MNKEQVINTAREMWENNIPFDRIMEYIDGAITELVSEAVNEAVAIDRIEGPR